MQTDSEIREAALSPEGSFIVQAPAGSGKTGLLTQRLLCLLGTAAKLPEECLAITFTRKAAREMKDRVIAALQNAENSEPPADPYHRKTWELARKVLAKDHDLGWELKNNPSRLKIQTIDAFCASLSKQMPVISQLGVMPRIAEDPSAHYQAAAQHILKAIETAEPWSGAVKVLCAHLDNNWTLIGSLLANMLSHRDQWLPYLGTTFSNAFARELLEKGLTMVVSNTLEELCSTIPTNLGEILPCAAFAAKELLLQSSDSDIIHCAALSQQWPGSNLSDLQIWRGIGELLFTQDHEPRKTVTVKQGFPAKNSVAINTNDQAYYQAMKSKMLACLESLEQYPEFIQKLQDLRECPPLEYKEAEWEVVMALAKVLPILCAELKLVFEESGEVDFTEITLAALRALGDIDEPTDLALRLDYTICHILVDEFQDTSLSQFRLLEKLTLGWQENDGRTLFLVGDPMQSIYRFRQAEVGLFIRAKQQGVGEIRLKPLQLSANFRSDPVVVSWIQDYFQEKFPKQEDMTTGAVFFHASEAVLKRDPNARALIESVSLETEAELVVKLVKQHQETTPTASIALLVRSRNHLQEILPALRLANIAYQGIDLEGLEDRRVVQDLLLLTRCLLHLGDRIAWLALLRAPWSPLGLEDLWCIANFDPNLALWHSLESYQAISNLSEAAKEYLRTLFPVLRSALDKRARVSLRQWVTETWTALADLSPHRIEILKLLNTEDALAFLEILEEQDNQGIFTLEELETRLKALYAKPRLEGTSQSLQIMTIHKAKGLEFDTVIVPGVGKKMASDPSQLLLWEEGINKQGSYFLLGPIQEMGGAISPIYAYLRRQEKRRAEYESTRLAYVAATRARKCLYWLQHKN